MQLSWTSQWHTQNDTHYLIANKLLIVILYYDVFDLSGWRKNLLPFPKGWSRVVTTRRHLSVGTYNRKRTITLLLCAKRASSVRSVVIERRLSGVEWKHCNNLWNWEKYILHIKEVCKQLLLAKQAEWRRNIYANRKPRREGTAGNKSRSRLLYPSVGLATERPKM